MLTDILSEREGFGYAVTGGAAGPTIEFSDDASLRAALATAGPKWIVPADGLRSGTIDFPVAKSLEVISDTTLDMRGANVNFHGPNSHTENVFQFGTHSNTNNVILINVRVNEGVNNWDKDGEGMDCLNLKNTNGFWFHHLELSQSIDGLIDIRENVKTGSVTWSRFRNDFQACMWYGEDLTLAHCWATNVRRRFPKSVDGSIHAYNNLIEGWLDAPIEEGKGKGVVLSEYSAWGNGGSSAIGKGKVNSSHHFSTTGKKLTFLTEKISDNWSKKARNCAKLVKPSDWGAFVADIKARAGATL